MVWFGLWYLTLIFQLHHGGQFKLVEEIEIHGESHRPVASHWQTLLHNVVSSTLRLYSLRPSVTIVCTRNSSYILHKNSFTAVWIDYIWKSICHFELRIFPLSSPSIRHKRLSVQLLLHFNWEFLKTRHAF